jgi:hypothetical protein
LVRDRLRRVPEQFSWVDHRLVRQAWIRRCDPRGLALYLLLVTVADVEGLSYYSVSMVLKNSPKMAFEKSPLLWPSKSPQRCGLEKSPPIGQGF